MTSFSLSPSLVSPKLKVVFCSQITFFRIHWSDTIIIPAAAAMSTPRTDRSLLYAANAIHPTHYALYTSDDDPFLPLSIHAEPANLPYALLLAATDTSPEIRITSEHLDDLFLRRAEEEIEHLATRLANTEALLQEENKDHREYMDELSRGMKGEGDWKDRDVEKVKEAMVTEVRVHEDWVERNGEIRKQIIGELGALMEVRECLVI